MENLPHKLSTTNLILSLFKKQCIEFYKKKEELWPCPPACHLDIVTDVIIIFWLE